MSCMNLCVCVYGSRVSVSANVLETRGSYVT